jgi:hypothetical protein
MDWDWRGVNRFSRKLAYRIWQVKRVLRKLQTPVDSGPVHGSGFPGRAWTKIEGDNNEGWWGR